MGIIFKKQGIKLQVYYKLGKKWKYLGEFEDVVHILHLMIINRNSVGIIKEVLCRTTPHFGQFLTDLGRNWRQWYREEFLPLVQEKVL